MKCKDLESKLRKAKSEITAFQNEIIEYQIAIESAQQERAENYLATNPDFCIDDGKTNRNGGETSMLQLEADKEEGAGSSEMNVSNCKKLKNTEKLCNRYIKKLFCKHGENCHYQHIDLCQQNSS